MEKQEETTELNIYQVLFSGVQSRDGYMVVRATSPEEAQRLTENYLAGPELEISGVKILGVNDITDTVSEDTPIYSADLTSDGKGRLN